MWIALIIFIMTLLGGPQAGASSNLFGRIFPACLCDIVGPTVDDPSRVRELLVEVAALEDAPARTELDTLWNPQRILSASNAPESEAGAFAVFHGRLEQITLNDASISGPAECFVRVAGAGPVIVFVSPDDLESCAISDQVLVEGWFHRVEEARARDGLDRRYPVFVARLRPYGARGMPVETSVLVTGLCLVLGAAWWIIRRRMRGASPVARKARMASNSVSSVDSSVPAGDLPTDPVRALDELARRGDDSR